MKKDNLKQQYRINEQIRVREVRIVGDDVESTVMPTAKALQMAEAQGVDLVEISPNAVPPVCRLIDYSKFLYQQKKRQKEMKAKQVKVDVKAYVFFKGRSILFKEQGEVLLLRFANDLEEYGKVEQMPVLEGKRMTIFIAPKKQAQAKKQAEPVAEVSVQKAERSQPKANAPKEYKGPRVEGED